MRPRAEELKRRVREFIDVTWVDHDFDRLDQYWTVDCVNHAAPPDRRRGLTALRDYHAQFASQFAGFSDAVIDVLQQVAEGDRVATHLVTRARHTGEFAGITPTGRRVSVMTIRVDRFAGDKITEHWSVADVAGLLTQLTE